MSAVGTVILSWLGAGVAWLAFWKTRRAIHGEPQTVRRPCAEQAARDGGACGDGEVGE